MGQLGWPEILGIIALVLLVFGVGRVRKLGGELGSGIRAFREGLKGEDEETASEETSDTDQEDTP